MPRADAWRADRQANEDFMDEESGKRLMEAMASTVITNAEELTELDRQIGDGDHGLNMKRGFEAVLEALPATAAKPLPEALKGVGTTLVMKVGGASGPLYGTFFLALGKTMPDTPTAAALAEAFAAAVEAGKARGKSQAGQRTMLDVLGPVSAVLMAGAEGVGGVGRGGGAMRGAIDRAWTPVGVVILVDLGGAETNSEMAVEMLDETRRGRVAVCNAPIVEGAVIAATEASGGSSLDVVRRMAEELSPQ